jgi:hypothetical protein
MFEVPLKRTSWLKTSTACFCTRRGSEKDKELSNTVEHHLGNHRDGEEVGCNSLRVLVCVPSVNGDRRR